MICQLVIVRLATLLGCVNSLGCASFVQQSVHVVTVESSGDRSKFQVDRTSEVDHHVDECSHPNTTYYASRPDGFGEQYALQMYALALARRCNGCYRFEGFNFFDSKWGSHDQWDADTFAGLKSDANCGGGGRSVKWPKGRRDQGFYDEFFSQEVRDELRASYWSSAKMDRDRDCKVAFHDRRGDAELIPWHDHAYINKSTGNELLRVTIEKQFQHKRVCIISEGQPAEFGSLQTMPKVTLKLDDSTGEAFHKMVTAPELVIGHSALSWAAGILSTGRVYFFPWHGGFVHTNRMQCNGCFTGRELSNTWHPL